MHFLTSCSLRNWMVSWSLPGKDLRMHIIPWEIEYSWFDPIEWQAQIGFLNIWQPLRVTSYILLYHFFCINSLYLAHQQIFSHSSSKKLDYLLINETRSNTGTSRKMSTRGMCSMQFGYPVSLILTWIILFGAGSMNLRRADCTILSFTAFTQKRMYIFSVLWCVLSNKSVYSQSKLCLLLWSPLGSSLGSTCLQGRESMPSCC